MNRRDFLQQVAAAFATAGVVSTIPAQVFAEEKPVITWDTAAAGAQDWSVWAMRRYDLVMSGIGPIQRGMHAPTFNFAVHEEESFDFAFGRECYLDQDGFLRPVATLSPDQYQFYDAFIAMGIASGRQRS